MKATVARRPNMEDRQRKSLPAEAEVAAVLTTGTEISEGMDKVMGEELVTNVPDKILAENVNEVLAKVLLEVLTKVLVIKVLAKVLPEGLTSIPRLPHAPATHSHLYVITTTYAIITHTHIVIVIVILTILAVE